MAENPDNKLDLSGKTAVVTGSSSGIGRQIALQLASAGADCLIHAAHRIEAAKEVAEQIRNYGVASKVELADFSETLQQDLFCETAFQWQDGVDIWVNNAGADVLTGEATEWSFEDKLNLLWKVDVVATMRIGRQAGQRMKSAGSGVMLNMGWDQAEVGMAGESGELFAATKGAIMAFSRSLARSLAPEVRVNCLAPGWIKTAWGNDASDEWQSRAQDESLLGRWGAPEDVAGLAHFLVAPASSFITGQVISVNGGRK